MSFREKSAWISLIVVLLTAAAFFLHVPWTLRPGPSPGLAHVTGLFLILLVLIDLIGRILVFVTAPKGGLTGKDERERLIDLKAARSAFYVLLAGNLLALPLVHFGADPFAVAFAVVLSIVVAFVVNYSARIYLYRRS
jgi:hypothetical protein